MWWTTTDECSLWRKFNTRYNREVDTNIKHEQPNPRNQTSHTVNIKKIHS